MGGTYGSPQKFFYGYSITLKMEYLGMFLGYFATSVVTTRVIFKNQEVLNIGTTFIQGGIIVTGIILFTVLMTMLRAYRTCPATTPAKKKSLGFTSGLSLSVWAASFAMIYFVLGSFFSIFTNIATLILPFLANFVEFVKGFYLAIFAIIGMGIGNAFISIC